MHRPAHAPEEAAAGTAGLGAAGMPLLCCFPLHPPILPRRTPAARPSTSFPSRCPPHPRPSRRGHTRARGESGSGLPGFGLPQAASRPPPAAPQGSGDYPEPGGVGGFGPPEVKEPRLQSGPTPGRCGVGWEPEAAATGVPEPACLAGSLLASPPGRLRLSRGFSGYCLPANVTD